LSARDRRFANNPTLVESSAERKAAVWEARGRVLSWWDGHRREFPWRAAPGAAPNPYFVWLSEIMLQQTTVTTVAPYFERFTRRWPSLAALAAAAIDDVVDEFAGLGYYSRARNLHACASLLDARGGEFPRKISELRALPGVGDYTAKAIAAISFGLPCVPVDANIRRILCRFHGLERLDGDGKKRLAGSAELWADSERSGDLAQGLMDLGALVCRPRQPSCTACPLRDDCVATRSEPTRFPAQPKKNPRRFRFGVAFYAQDRRGHFLVRRRPANGLLAGTLELPGAIGMGELDESSAQEWRPFPGLWERLPDFVEHIFTHFTLRMAVFRGTFDEVPVGPKSALMPPTPKSFDRLSSAMAKAARYAQRS